MKWLSITMTLVIDVLTCFEERIPQICLTVMMLLLLSDVCEKA